MALCTRPMSTIGLYTLRIHRSSMVPLRYVIVGYFDWQHFYGGSFLFPIKMKLALAVALLVLLMVSVAMSMRSEKGIAQRLLMHSLSLLVVAGIGYFGGELVYGKKASPRAVSQDAAKAEPILAGTKLFEQKCSFCYFTDRTDTKVDPGLKGLFQRGKMPVSGWSVSQESVRRQLKTPFDQMPAFEGISSEEIDELTDYLKSL